MERRINRVTAAVWHFSSGAVGSLTHSLVLHTSHYQTGTATASHSAIYTLFVTAHVVCQVVSADPFLHIVYNALLFQCFISLRVYKAM